jgi:hypothetical protein
MSSPVAPIGARGRGRPEGPVDPFTALRRRLANPNWAAAFLARLIAHEYGEKLHDAAVDAIVLLTPPAQWPADQWPREIAWFHGAAGPMRSAPELRRVKTLLDKGRV